MTLSCGRSSLQVPAIETAFLARAMPGSAILPAGHIAGRSAQRSGSLEIVSNTDSNVAGVRRDLTLRRRLRSSPAIRLHASPLNRKDDDSTGMPNGTGGNGGGNDDDRGSKRRFDMPVLDDATYKAWQETYVRCSNEKAKVASALKEIIGGLGARDSFLDIGAGDGDLTLRLRDNFSRTTVVDANAEVREIFESKGIRFVCDYFEKTDLGDDPFDFILCSHVFWLVKKEARAAFIQKALDRLSESGKMAIVMGAPRGQSHEFHELFFYGYDMSSNDILVEMEGLGLAPQTIPVSVRFQTPSFDDFFNICKLFVIQSWLHPANITDAELRAQIGDIEEYTKKRLEEIAEYIETQCFHDGMYSMDMEIDILVSGRK